MKWFKWLLLGLIALALLFVGVGLALPSPLRVERSVAIAAPAGEIDGPTGAPVQPATAPCGSR